MAIQRPDHAKDGFYSISCGLASAPRDGGGNDGGVDGGFARRWYSWRGSLGSHISSHGGAGDFISVKVIKFTPQTRYQVIRAYVYHSTVFEILVVEYGVQLLAQSGDVVCTEEWATKDLQLPADRDP